MMPLYGTRTCWPGICLPSRRATSWARSRLSIVDTCCSFTQSIAMPTKTRCAALAMWSIDKKRTSRMNKMGASQLESFPSKVCIEPQCHLTSPWHMHQHTSKELETSVTISSFVMNSEASRFIVPSFRIHSAKIGEMEVESEQLQQSMGLFVDSRTVPNSTDIWQAWSIDLGSSNNSHLSNRWF